MNQMRMRINKTWQNNAPRNVNLFGLVRRRELLDFIRWSDGSDEPIADKRRTVLNNSKLGKGFAAPRTAPAQSQQLGRTCNEKGIAHDSFIMTNLSSVCLPAETLHALADLALYAGANTSFANVSSVVEVVFFSERTSFGFISPSLNASFISLISAAVFAGSPICFRACSTINPGNLW